MRDQSVGASARLSWLALLVLLGIGCSEGDSGPTTDAGTAAETGAPTPDGGGGTGGGDGAVDGVDGQFSGPPMQPTPAERTAVRIRVVHLFSPGMGQPGPAVDV